MSRKFLNGIDLASQRITSVASPTGANDATNKSYVDNLVAGLSWKDEVRVATTANGTLASAYENGDTVDGVVLATGDRILIKNQSTQSENGIYIVNASGAPTRATDADSTAELNNATVLIVDGTVGAGLSYTQTTKNPTVGSSNIVWAQFNAGTTYTASLGVALSGTDFRLASGAAGAGLTLTTGVLDVVATDTSVTVAADSLGVNLAASSGLAISSGLKVDRAVVMTRYAADIGDGAATAITKTHNLGTLDVVVAVFDKSSGDEVECDVNHATTNTVTVTFAVAPTTNQYRLVVIG